ncbi:MAG: response regulator transcription factor [Deltaproteobacteria bacterium]|nr:response regulator transcription factor [Deltaproteobacteria bacterium]
MKRIILVEDSPIIQAAAVYALGKAGYEVSVRTTFEELMSKSLTGYDLILMDVQMPELFGDDVAAVLRNERGVTTPIYLFSSLSKGELHERAQAAKVDGFISKEGGMEELITRVKQILG